LAGRCSTVQPPLSALGVLPEHAAPLLADLMALL